MTALQVPNIETERLFLRGPTSADLPDWITRVWSDADVMRSIGLMDVTPEVFAQAALTAFTDARNRQQLGAWIITDKGDGQFMGHCAVLYRDATHEHELGYVLAKAYWGNGYATEAARAMVRYGFEHAHLDHIVAATLPGNVASRRVLEHVGFTYERDVNYYEMTSDTTIELESPMTTYYVLRREQFAPSDASFHLD